MNIIAKAEKSLAAALPLTLTLALGATACTGNRETKHCLSPAVASGLYPGDKEVTNNQDTWQLGVVITDNGIILKPALYRGMVIGFGSTASNTEGLAELPSVGYPFGDPHLSRPVSPAYRDYLVKIGPNDVIFTARRQAIAGSPDCDRPPDDVIFGPAQPLDEIFRSSSPDPGPVSPDWP